MSKRERAPGRLGSALGVRRGEGRRTALLFAQLLLASSVFILGRTVRDTLFLSRYPLSALPWMFVLYGVASSVTAVVYARFADKIPRHVAIGASVGIGIVTYLGVWVLVKLQATWVYPVFYVWSEVAANLFIVQFWTLANDLHDPRSAKRLFGTIGAARVLGVVLIGTSTGAIVRAVGTAQLLFLLAILMAAIGAIAFSLRSEPRPEQEAPRPISATSRSVARDPYVQVLSLFLLFTFTALTVGDYQFKAVARATYREDELAQFFSLFYAATGIISFLFQIAVTPRLLRRLGVGWGMSVMPGVFGTASAILPFFPNLAVASAMKFADNGFQYTIHETTLQALYVPFPAQAKARTRAMLDAVVKPCAYGAGGLVLIVLAQRLPVEQLSYATWGLVLVWVAAIPMVRRRYVTSLEATLSARGTLALDADFVLDASSRRALLGVLQKGDPRYVIAAIEQLGSDDSAELRSALEKLAESPDPAVRHAALHALGTLPGASPRAAEVGLGDDDPAVRAAAAEAFAALAGDECVESLLPRLEDQDPEVRIAATAGLLKHAGVEGAIVGGGHLEELILSERSERRTEAALVLRAIGPGAYRPLRKLLTDSDGAVRRAALKACETVADARLVPTLVDLLGDPAVRLKASRALEAIGEPALDPLLALMSDEATPREIRLVIPRILRKMPSRRTYARLFEHVGAADSHLRLRVLGALSSVRKSMRMGPEPLDEVKNLLRTELARAYRNLAGWHAARGRYETPLLAEEMDFRHVRAIRRILRILELRYAPEPLHLVRERLEEPRRRANALEVLDSMLEPGIRPLVMRFLDDVPVPELVAAAGDLVPPVPSPSEFMREESAHPNPYVTLVALDALAKHHDPLVIELGEAALTRLEPLAREGALSALVLAEPGVATRLLPRLQADPDPTVRHHARVQLARLSGSELAEVHMHSTVEKILYLKSAPLFAKVTGEDLAPLAHVALEELHAKGTHIFDEGEPGDSLYVIVSGRIAIVHGSETVATLGAGEAFGEMAVLDKAPRSAGAVALEDTELLRIGSQEFYEILHEQTEIAVGVIRMLTQRLRESTAGAPERPRLSIY